MFEMARLEETQLSSIYFFWKLVWLPATQSCEIALALEAFFPELHLGCKKGRGEKAWRHGGVVAGRIWEKDGCKRINDKGMGTTGANPRPWSCWRILDSLLMELNIKREWLQGCQWSHGHFMQSSLIMKSWFICSKNSNWSWCPGMVKIWKENSSEEGRHREGNYSADGWRRRN